MYLVMGESYALLGGGVPWVVQKLESQLDDFNIDRKRIRHVVISHAHHDHCGAVPYLLGKYPHIKTVSSQYCAYILNHSKPVSLIEQVNKSTLDALKHPHAVNGIPLDFHPIPIDLEVNDGDRLDLGDGLSLQFFQTPGHSRCSLSVYIPELKALFPADAVPFPEEEKRELTVTANHDYDEYIQSLEKLQNLDIHKVCYEHGGVLTEDDAAGIIPRSLEATLQQRERIQNRYEELKDFDRLVDEIAEKYQTLELFRLVPADTMRVITKRMVKSALGLT
jgi:2-aminobenzoylacetyl-CoA thioesterase